MLQVQIITSNNQDNVYFKQLAYWQLYGETIVRALQSRSQKCPIALVIKPFSNRLSFSHFLFFLVLYICVVQGVRYVELLCQIKTSLCTAFIVVSPVLFSLSVCTFFRLCTHNFPVKHLSDSDTKKENQHVL